MNRPARYLFALTSGISAIALIFRDRPARSLALRPLVLGLAIFVGLLALAIFSFRSVAELFLQHTYYHNDILARGAIGILLLIVVSILSVSIVFVLSAVYSLKLMARAFELHGSKSRADLIGLSAFPYLVRSGFIETAKIVVLAPLFVLSLLMSMVPMLFPFGFMLGSWIMGLIFLDTALDAAGEGAGYRLSFPFRHLITVTLFGIPWTVLSLVPFGAVLISPFASTAAALLLAEGKLLRRGAQSLPEPTKSA